MSTFEERLKDSLSHSYEIERELSGGGMSRVFVATDRSLGRRIVVKVLPSELTAGVNRGRFRREIQVAAQLQHPHIVTLLSADEDDDIVYYTMPFSEGESLRLECGDAGVGNHVSGHGYRYASVHGENFTVVDQDSVRGILAQTRSRADVERVLNPDVLIEQTYTGLGDSTTVIVSLRDRRNPSGFGRRVVSTKISASNPQADPGTVVQLVMGQLHALAHAPIAYRALRPPMQPAGINDR
jgi:hypothetical protein